MLLVYASWLLPRVVVKKMARRLKITELKQPVGRMGVGQRAAGRMGVEQRAAGWTAVGCHSMRLFCWL